jgi:pimeloyl-ACP methyl ester carboxylesterase
LRLAVQRRMATREDQLQPLIGDRSGLQAVLDGLRRLRRLQQPGLGGQRALAPIFGDRDFSPLPDVVEMFELLPNAQLAVLPGTTHVGVTRRPGEVLALITPFLDAR